MTRTNKRKYFKWIDQKLIDRATKEIRNSDFYNRLLGAFILLISGLMLFTDKIISVDIENTFGFKDSQTFMWVLCQSLSPIVLCIGAMLKPRKAFYLAPLYLYFIQVFWVFQPQYKLDDPLLHIYALGFSLSILLFTITTIFLLRLARNNSNVLLFNMRQMTTFIIKDVRTKYISQSNRKKFAEDVIKLNNNLK